jgi:hypothetical protein
VFFENISRKGFLLETSVLDVGTLWFIRMDVLNVLVGIPSAHNSLLRLFVYQRKRDALERASLFSSWVILTI